MITIGPFITDDYGMRWYYDETTSHIRCYDDPSDTEGDGYYCSNLLDGFVTLIDLGYISTIPTEDCNGDLDSDY